MMNDLELAEAIGFPTQHIGLHFIDRVPPWSLPQAADRFPTGSSIDLGCSSDMKLGSGFKFPNSPNIVINGSPAHSKLGVTLKMSETFLKVIWGQRQVAVELHDEIPAIAAKGTVAVIEGFHHSAAGLTKTSVHSVYDADPWQLSCMPIDNFTRPVGGTVVDDYP